MTDSAFDFFCFDDADFDTDEGIEIKTVSLDFGFVHKKRLIVKGEQGTSFNFAHKKRLPPSVPAMGGFVPGAFADSFDSNSFDVLGLFFGGTLTKVNDFLFRHIK